MKISSISEGDFFKELEDAKKESMSALGISDGNSIDMGVIEQSEVHKLLSGSAEKNNDLPVIQSVPVNHTPGLDKEVSNDPNKQKVISKIKSKQNKTKKDQNKKLGL